MNSSDGSVSDSSAIGEIAGNNYTSGYTEVGGVVD